MSTAVIYVLLAVALGIVAVVMFPDATQLWFGRISRAKEITSAVSFLAFALVFVLSGVDILVFIGMLMLIFAVWQAVFHEERVAEFLGV